MRSKLILLSLAAMCLCFCVAADGQSYAITNARIVTVSGAPIEKGTVVVRDGLIVSVGANVQPPADAHVFDATGLTVYPGFIDTMTTLGLPQAAAPQTGPGGFGGGRGQAQQQPQQQAQPTSNSNYPSGLRPEEMAVDDVRAGESQFETARSAGFTTVLSIPRAGIWNGQSAVIDLAGDSVSAMVIKPVFGEHVSFATIGGGQFPSSLMGTFAALRQMLLDAQRLQEWQRLYAANPKGMKRPEADKSLEALVPVINGRMPVIFNANDDREIVRALDLIREFKLNGVIAGGQQAWKVADRLKAQNVPVLLSLNFPRRSTANSADADPEPLETLRLRSETPKGPGRLAAAGVKFAFQSSGITNLSDFFANAGRAVENGLSRDAAVRAMTLGAAELLGVADRTGSIENGKIANLTLVRGDLFGRDKFVPQVIIDGKIFEIQPPQRPQGGGRGNQGGGQAPGAGNPAGPNLSGNYSINIDIGGQAVPAAFAFTQSGAALTGTMTPQGGGSAPIRDGRVTGDGFSFAATVPFQGNNIEISVHGTVSGSQISGTIDSPLGAVPFSGSRTPSTEN